MFKPDHPTANNGQYTEGNISQGIPATVVKADHMNAITNELSHIIQHSGLTLNKSDSTQLRQAVLRLIGSPFDPSSIMVTNFNDLNHNEVPTTQAVAAYVLSQIFDPSTIMATNFNNPNNDDVPTTQAVVNYVTSAIPDIPEAEKWIYTISRNSGTDSARLTPDINFADFEVVIDMHAIIDFNNSKRATVVVKGAKGKDDIWIVSGIYTLDLGGVGLAFYTDIGFAVGAWDANSRLSIDHNQTTIDIYTENNTDIVIDTGGTGQFVKLHSFLRHK